ncbi:ABC transporter ATP-binding protein [Nocardiopsis exhalans]|uniref:ABC transporter ATP-binding protein n=1 Tax=Nocardiopsis exhalans TaxID=163604 RepID=A0ABY5D1E0_9ACTN|nr:ABC transporter ATP-binding protein [Nocardiopsis exhalans]USY17245.1 ABC transporter ATP-binding protein [Nocardiopsis exhalans]
MRLTLHGIGVRLGSSDLLHEAHLDVAPGTVTGLLGPNGSGKSTLLRTVYRAVRPRTGAALLDGEDLWSLPSRQVARSVAVVAQESPAEFDLQVLDVVLMGRTPHKGPFSSDDEHDLTLALDALDRVGADHLAERMVATLSGGERQRVMLARALVQQTPLLVLDEPTNHLDISFQLELLSIVRGLGVTVVVALHDMNLAAAYCDTVSVLAAGRVVAAGEPERVLTPELMLDVFGVRCHRLTHPESGRMVLAFSEPSPVSAPPSVSANEPRREPAAGSALRKEHLT